METFDLWREWLPSLLDGLKTSLLVCLASIAIGLPIGLLLALGVKAKSMAVRAASLGIVEIGRGAPALILLQFAYFGLPSAGLTLSSFTAAIIGLSICTGAYTSEIIRAGLESVPAGQGEAAAALGLGTLDSLRFVILPQGLIVAVPALLGFCILILQATSLCFTIALPELVSQAYQIGSNTFEYASVLTLSGLIYAAICMPSTLIVSALERRLGAHNL